MLFSILSYIDDNNRFYSKINPVWPRIWENQGLAGPAPDLASIIDKLKSEGLVEAQVIKSDVKYSIHPGVAEAGLAKVGEGLRTAVDSVMSDFWLSIYSHVTSEEGQGLEGWILRACLNAVPYLMRQKMWVGALALLEQAVQRDKSSGTLAAILPMVRYIAEAMKGAENEIPASVVLARALLDAGRLQESEDIYRSLISKCEAIEDFRNASVSAGYLITILMNTGRSEEALKLLEDKKSYTSRASLGPWSQLMDEGYRLRVLCNLGQYEEALKEVDKLMDQMKSLPGEDLDGVSGPEVVKGKILEAGFVAALALEKWEQALDFNAEDIENSRAQGKPDLELTKLAFYSYGPLLNLGRYKEARDLLYRCKENFEEDRNIEMLGGVFTALAHLENRLGHVAQAIEFGQRALRYSYITPDPALISTSHNNLAIYLSKAGFESVLAHDLASAIIDYQTSSGRIATSLSNLAIHLDEFGSDTLPGSFDELCNEMEKVEGVRFRELFDHLPKRAKDGDEAGQAVINMLMEMAGTQSEEQPPAQGDAEG